ncbi:MAG: DNA repair protein RecO [Clostridia bacterium]|nr:DNA repair protein RecO [Clostridia bacterium]
MKTVTAGLVIKEMNIGEADKLITILTKDNGIVKAYASGVKSIKSKRSVGTTLLSYSDFSFTKSGKNLRVSEAVPIKHFFSADADIEAFAISQYFCELCAVFEPTEGAAPEFLRLILNSLHFLNEKSKSPLIIKAITELRIAAKSGYCPNLVACEECGAYEDEIMFFNLENGTITCKNCNKNESNIPLDKTLIKAMRHIVYSPFERLYSFSVPDDAARRLSGITERYITYQTDRSFKTLDFLNTIYTETEHK